MLVVDFSHHKPLQGFLRPVSNQVHSLNIALIIHKKLSIASHASLPISVQCYRSQEMGTILVLLQRTGNSDQNSYRKQIRSYKQMTRHTILLHLDVNSAD